MQTLQSATEHYQRQQRINARGLVAARRLRSDPARLLAVVAAFQVAAAEDAAAAVPLMLTEQGIDTDMLAEPNPRALAGWSSSGWPMGALLAKVSGPDVAGDVFDRFVLTQYQDTARQSAALTTGVTPTATGYVRMLNPPSCSRCVILAGKWYRKNQGFQRHPRCFPAGTVVSGPGADGATRRWYEGELVVIRTAGGKELSATGNHPVLTDQGWLPANLLAEGGYVVSRSGGDRSRALVVPDEDQVPARIEDVWRSGGMSALGTVPVAAEDFHGDGLGSSHVDVVLADRLLWGRGEVADLEHLRQQHLAIGAEAGIPFAVSRANLEFGEADLLSAGGRLRGLRLLGSLVGFHSAGSQEPRLARATNAHALLDETRAHGRTADAQASRDGVLALATDVVRDDLGGVEPEISARWDAPASPFSVEARGAYARSGQDLRLRLAGEVELDRVVEVRRVEWSGHVFNLTSREGWYDANGIIVSNCDCRHIPTSEGGRDLRLSPEDYFDSLPRAEQDRVFTKGAAEILRRTEDHGQRQYLMGRLVNTRWGTRTSQRLDTKRRQMPETILARAGDDQAALLRQLKAHRYIK